MAKDLESQREAKEQALQLARDLSINNKPPLLKTLHCAGLVQDTNEKRFGFLFDLPDWVDVASEPRTLHSYLAEATIASKSIPLPTLRERFILARDLAYSVAELHGANILHKSLHSGNILFFPARFTKVTSISSPFIGGFEVSRRDQKGQLSLDIAGSRFDLYRHPELRDPSNELQGRPPSDRKYDIYSLGLILLEIGIWSRLDSLQQERKSPAENAKRFLEFAHGYLPHHMGTDYCDAVLECLDTKCQSLIQSPRSPSSAQRGGLSSELFIQNVIRRLELSIIRESV